MRLIVKLLLLLGCWCSLWFFPALATAVPLPEAHTVRVGWYPIKGLQDGTDNISLNGYNYEYLQQVAQYTNWRYQFVFGSWSQLDAQLKAGQIDILGNIGKIPGRENEYSFCAYPNGSKRMQLVCLQKNKQFSYDDFTAFKDASVATMTSPFVMMQLEELQKERQLNFKYYFYATNNDVIEALEDGTADLAMLSDMNDLANCKIVYQWEKTPFYFVVNKEKPQILAELNAAMKMLQSADRFLEERLFRRYFGNNQNSMGLSLTSEEQAYIEQRKTPLRFYQA